MKHTDRRHLSLAALALSALLLTGCGGDGGDGGTGGDGTTAPAETSAPADTATPDDTAIGTVASARPKCAALSALCTSPRMIS